MPDFHDLPAVTQILYALCITVMAITIIYRVCELMVEAHQDLDEEKENAKRRKAQAEESQSETRRSD